MSSIRISRIVGFSVLAGLFSGDALAQSDWDLHMLRLVNRARQDPAGEPARIGSVVTDPSGPLGLLAYDLSVAESARNHNTWMHDNLGSIATTNAPDSFTHSETLDGTASGTPATGTPSYTGAGIGDRITAAGFTWGRASENLSALQSSESIPVNQELIETNHKGWWESGGHRDNMLNTDVTVFGHHAESRTISPPIGNIASFYDNLHYATQNFARPLSTPYTYIFGLLYDDKDGSGDWTPRNEGHALREGLADVSFQVLDATWGFVITNGTTMDNGAFSVNVDDGVYDIVFTDAALPTGTYTASGVSVSGANVDAGDLEVDSAPPPDDGDGDTPDDGTGDGDGDTPDDGTGDDDGTGGGWPGGDDPSPPVVIVPIPCGGGVPPLVPMALLSLWFVHGRRRN